MNNRFSLALVLMLALARPAVARAPDAPVKFDFQAMALGDLPAELAVTDGEVKFAITADGANHVLELNPSPLVDGGVLQGPSVKGAVTVKARQGGGKTPQPSEIWRGAAWGGRLSLSGGAGGEGTAICQRGGGAGTGAHTWKSGTWTVMEFSVMAAADGGSSLEVRAREEGQPRPDAAVLTLAVKTPPAIGKASLWAAPYAELPIAFDDVVITAMP